MSKTENTLKWLSKRPIAHRGLHDVSKNIVENSMSAVKAALDGNFSIEVDLQISSDEVPIVFHDLTLGRLTEQKGSVRNLSIDELTSIPLKNTSDKIPRLSDLLKLVDGRVGLVLEVKGIKDCDSNFIKSILKTCKDYQGPLALMSFDHWLLEDARRLKCPLPLGLVVEGKDNKLHQQAADAYDVDFVSFNIKHLPNKFVENFRASGKPVICWTVRDEIAMQKAALYTDQITFEGFDPK